jgi:chemotaxis protein MotA
MEEYGRVFTVLKIGILNFAKGAPPAVAVEFARRAVYPTVRPSFVEVEEACRGKKEGA